MQFFVVAAYFERIEKTSSRLELVDLLAELFGQASAEEARVLAYMCQGRIAPFYEPTELGMGEKMVAEGLAKAVGVKREVILKGLDRLGDLGLVAQEVTSASTSTRLDLREVYRRLLEIAETKGAGSTADKQEKLADLLRGCEGLEAKFLVRIPLGTMRLGVGDSTLLDAFSVVKFGDRSYRKRLERVYNEISDLGVIAEELWRGGIEAVESLGISVGRPLRSQVPERIPTAEGVLAKMGPVLVQRKFDGFRTQIHKNGDEVEIFSRNLEDMTGMFPEVIGAVCSQVTAERAIIDGEALAYNAESGEYYPFQETTKRRRKHGVEAAAEALPLRVFAFDLLYVDGESLIDMPLTERLERLKGILTEGEGIVVAESEIVSEAPRLQLLLDEAITGGLEGLVVKRPDAGYSAGARNFNWVKLKRVSSSAIQDTIDCVILGYIYGRGKRTSFGAGALLVGVYDAERDAFVSISKIGTGLSDAEWQEIRQRCDGIQLDHKPARVISDIGPSVWVEPRVVIEVLCDEITRSPLHTAGRDAEGVGYALRFPRLMSFRDDDKRAEDATEVGEVVEMYQAQFAK